MMDEYERATAELTALLQRIEDEEFERARDFETQDEDCRSIQTIMRHVVRAGYGYAGYIRDVFGTEKAQLEFPLTKRHETLTQLEAMLAYTQATLEGKWELPYEEISAIQMRVRWGVVYDLEQLLEHAIVHVLRHRRQIERFLTEPRFAGKRQGSSTLR
jgi:uncharacterized damage-inducible protein DinB